MLAWLGLGWLLGLVAVLAHDLPLAPAVLWLAITAGMLLWRSGRPNWDTARRGAVCMSTLPQEPALVGAGEMAVPVPRPGPAWYGARIGYGALAAGALGLWAMVVLQQGWAAYVARVDFVALYLGGRLVTEGHGGHLYDIAVQQQMQAQIIAPYRPVVPLLFEYPAWNALLLAPLALLPLAGAFVVWTGLT